MSNLKLVNPEDFTGNFSGMFCNDWALLTAESEGKINTMTIGWGEIGCLFGKSVATVYVRPSRYTYQFLEKSSGFSISFFPKEMKKDLSYCGKMSGRNTDKIGTCGFTTTYYENVPYFEEASTTVICKKMYTHDIHPENITEAYKDEITKKYFPDGDFHRLYIGEIKAILENVG